ncbi:MAG: GerW family sporulation protein [Candidatus Bathyarchaeia archaeon]
MKIEKMRDVMRESSMVERLVGEPVHVDGRTLIPLIRVSLNLATLTRGHKERGEGGGWFCGASATPFALVVIDAEGERVLSLTKEEVSLIDLMETIPDLAAKIQQMRGR